MLSCWARSPPLAIPTMSAAPRRVWGAAAGVEPGELTAGDAALAALVLLGCRTARDNDAKGVRVWSGGSAAAAARARALRGRRSPLPA